MLSLLGGALGVLIAWWGGQLLLTLVQAGPDPLPIQVGPNARVLLFTFGLSLVTGVLFGLAPALRMTHLDLAPSLREGKGTARSQTRSRLGQLLVAGQVALALFLMIGAGLFVRTLQKLEQTGPGFDAARVVLLNLDSDASNFKGPAVEKMHRQLEERLRGLPGVQAASFSSSSNFNEGRWVVRLWPEGVQLLAANGKPADGNQVGSEYLRALGMPVVMGRGFGPQDTPQSPAALVVNETLARALYPGVSPIGRHVAMEGDKRPDLEIVGVVKDAKNQSLRDKPRGMFFIDLEQGKIPDTFSDLVARVRKARSADIADSGGDSCRGSESCGVGCNDVERSGGPFARAGKTAGQTREFLRRAGVAAGFRRALWRDGVFSGTAHQRNRDSDGAGRTTKRRARNGAARIRASCWIGIDGRNSSGAGLRTLRVEPALWTGAERSGYHCQRERGVTGGGAGSELPAGAACGDARSISGFARGVARIPLWLA